MMVFNHLSNYEFLGKFWYLEHKDTPITGRLIYTKNKGIKLELLNPTHIEIKIIKDAKIMHAVLLDEGEIRHATLLDVFIHPETIYVSSGAQQRIYGSARVLVGDGLLWNNKIVSLDVEYDRYFKNAVYYPGKEITHALQYAKQPMKTQIGKIKFDSQFTGHFISTEEDIDELCWTLPENEAKLEKLKKIIINYIKDNNIKFFKRISPYSIVSFENNSKTYDVYLNNEKIWRSFWEILINHHICVEQCWIKAYDNKSLETGKKYCSTYSVLISHINLCPDFDKYKRIKSKHFLPLSIDSFGEDRNLSKIYLPFSKWINMSKDKRLNILMSGLTKIIYQQDIITTDDYMSLITYIETAMDFLGNKENRLNTLIDNYADQEWLKAVKSIVGKTPHKNNIAVFLTEVRNVITHPKSAGKASGIYMKFALDDIKLQAAYSYLTGLLFKAILKYLYDFEDNKLKQYIKEVISSRRVYKIIYK